MKTTVKKMESHVQGLCAQHGITVGSHSRGGRASRNSKTIWIRPVRSSVTYFVALHEIAHVVYPPAGRGLRMEQEAHAWDWAIENAVAPISKTVRHLIHRCLDSYRLAGERSKNMKMPPSEHKFWELLNA